VTEGVSFVVPVYNGEPWLARTLDAVVRELGDRPGEVVIVDDGSCDGSAGIIRAYARHPRIRCVDGPRRGAAAALNAGIAQARYPIVCQIDQDVAPEPGWLQEILAPLASAEVAASQGWYATPRDASLWARAAGLDLELRYHRLRALHVNHVCSGNTAYRLVALRTVGPFDERFGYGYDNDMSYRLAAAGYRLAFARNARSVHRWRERAGAYLRQQYGVGYGRLQLLWKHPGHIGADDVSGFGMIAHAGLMLGALVLGIAALACIPAGAAALGAATLSTGIVMALALERLVTGIRAARALGDLAALSFPLVHLARDVAWAAAIVAWAGRRLRGSPGEPWHSMRRAR
jgi:GT2 family glycosyltransferase